MRRNLANIGEFVKGSFKRVRISYKKRVKEIDIPFISDNIEARGSENEYVYIYIFDIISG